MDFVGARLQCDRIPARILRHFLRAVSHPLKRARLGCLQDSPRAKETALFYVRYIVSELRRRKGRTFLTALGLGVGVGLVITVAALSSGLDDAQDEVLEPLTGAMLVV